MKKNEGVYLHHILDAITAIENYLAGIPKDKFKSTPLLQDGVLRQLEIIGEAAGKLSEEFRASHTNIPWNEIIGLRNRVIHAYFNVNLDIIWEIAQNDLKSLQKDIAEMITPESLQGTPKGKGVGLAGLRDKKDRLL